MEALGSLFMATLNVFKIPLTIFGFTFSFFEVFAFTIVGGGLARLLRYIFLDK